MNRISVAMTTYNGEKFLKEQLDSILGQSRRVDELVVCDDGSTDNTVNMLNKFASIAPFPARVIINEKNLGSIKNFEKTMGLCNGDIIILCDQDDIWLPDKVKILENIFTANPSCGMAFTDAVVTDEKNNPLSKLWPVFGFDSKKQKTLKKGKGLKFFLGGNVVTGATAAVTRAFFEEAAPFPPEFVHDHWLASAAVLTGRLFFDDATTINYRQHSSQQLGIGTPPPKNSFFQRANYVTDFDKAINLTQIMLKEFDRKFNLTEKQRKVFTNEIEFGLFRNTLARNRLSRMPKIIMNILRGNYHRSASGFLSAVKDMYLPQNKRL